MALVHSLLGSFDHLECIQRTPRQHALVGHSGGAAVSLTAIASQTPDSTLRMDVVSSAHRWQAQFDHTALARPTEITLYDGNGALSRPLLYASGSRATWMHLHAAITEQASIPYSLEDLATDLEIAKRALNEPAQASPAAR
jgi:pimeloyl-ACP methyl ester carboxylesterase